MGLPLGALGAVFALLCPSLLNSAGLAVWSPIAGRPADMGLARAVWQEIAGFPAGAFLVFIAMSAIVGLLSLVAEPLRWRKLLWPALLAWYVTILAPSEFVLRPGAWEFLRFALQGVGVLWVLRTCGVLTVALLSLSHTTLLGAAPGLSATIAPVRAGALTAFLVWSVALALAFYRVHRNSAGGAPAADPRPEPR